MPCDSPILSLGGINVVGDSGAGGVSTGGAGAPGADGMLLGAVSIEADGVSPRSGDDVEGLLWDWVMCGACIGAPRSAAPSDVTPTLGSSGVAGLGVSGLLCQRSRAAHFLRSHGCDSSHYRLPRHVGWTNAANGLARPPLVVKEVS
jgi:hypothetical protein